MKVAIPSSTQLISNNGIVNSVWFTFFQNIWRAIRGDLGLNLGGMLNINTTSVSNILTNETNLISYFLNANTFVNEGDVLEIEAWGSYASNFNNKTVKLIFGNQTILTTGSVAANNGSWLIKSKIIMKTYNTQEIISEIISSNSSVANSATRIAGTQDLLTNLTIKCTAIGGSSNDITQYALKINLIPNT